MSSILIASYLIVYLILAVKRLDWAVMLLLAALPAYQIRFHVFGAPSTLLEAMILVATVIWVFRNYRRIIGNAKTRFRLSRNSKLEIRNSKFIRYPFDLEIIFILLISWGAIIAAGVTTEALGIWKAYFYEPALVFILVMNVFRSPRINKSDTNLQIINSVEKILWPLAVSAFAVSLIAIFQKFTGFFTVAAFLPRVTGPFAYPNALGLYLGPLVLIMIGWLLKIFNPVRQVFKFLFILFTVLTSLLAIFFARSEGAMVGVGVALLFFLGFAVIPKIVRSRTVIKIGFIKIFIIAALAFAFPLITLKAVPAYYYPHTGNKVIDYALNKAMLKDLSGEIRKQQWRETWRMMTESLARFIFGTGLSGYQRAVAPYHQEGIFFNREHDPDFRRKIVLFDEQYKAEHWQPVEVYMYPHSLVLNFWTEMGLAGALLFIWIIGKLLYIGVGSYESETKDSRRRYLALGLIGAMLVIVIHGIVDVPYFKNDLAVAFWVLAAMAGIMQLDNKTRKR